MDDLAVPLHMTVLRYLADGQWPRGMYPYCAVCHSCLAAAMSPDLWHEINLSSFEEDLPIAPSLRLLAKFARQVQVLNLRGCGDTDGAWVQAVVLTMSGHQLRNLDLGYVELNAHTLSSLVNLTSLEVLGLKRQTLVTAEDLRKICIGCPKLSELDLRHCDELRDSRCLLSGCDSSTAPWKVLKLDGCRQLRIDTLFCDRVQSWSRLAELTLDGEGILPDVYRQIAENCPQLRRFGVSFGEGFDATALSAFSTLRCLKRMRLRKVKGILDGSWVDFFDQQRRSKREADELINTQWETLCFAECEFWSDAAAHSLALTTLPQLRKLDLSWCWELSDHGVRQILDSAQQLECVKLIGIKNLTDRGLLPCTLLPKLRELDVTSVNKVNDWFLQFLHRLFNPDGDVFSTASSAYCKVWDVWKRLQPLRGKCSQPLQIRNYYSAYLGDDVRQFQSVETTLSLAEELLRNT